MIEKVVSYEYRSNNSTQKTVAHLECGHERVFEYGFYPPAALCWVCPDKNKDLPKVSGTDWFRFVTPGAFDGDVSDEYDHDAEAEDREGAE